MILLGCWYMNSVFGVFRRSLSRMATEYVAGTHSMAFVTVPDVGVAKKLAHGIVQQKLAACVNIIPSITSVYVWEGKVNEDSELILMIKTSSEKVPALSAYVRDNHPYDCAEVISSKIDDGNAPYLKWIGETVSGVPEDGNDVSDAKKQKMEND